jgi:hypothetical protein
MEILIGLNRKTWKTPAVQEVYGQLVAYFRAMQTILREYGYHDKFDLSTETSGLGIQRFWVQKWDDAKFDHEINKCAKKVESDDDDDDDDGW